MSHETVSVPLIQQVDQSQDVYDWRSDANCRDADPTDFEIQLVGNRKDSKGNNISQAMENARQRAVIAQYCTACVVKKECLDVATEQGSAAGMIWGGYTPEKITEIMRGLRKSAYEESAP